MSTVLSFGDVLLVPFPFTDQQGSKQRPAVVVSSSAYNANRSDVLIMAITSVMRSPGAALAFGEAVLADWQSEGLIKPSAFKTVFTTIDRGSSSNVSVPFQGAMRRCCEPCWLR